MSEKEKDLLAEAAGEMENPQTPHVAIPEREFGPDRKKKRNLIDETEEIYHPIDTHPEQDKPKE